MSPFSRLMSVSESDRFSDLDEISELSIPAAIQTYDDEEVLSGNDILGAFERDYLPLHLRDPSPEPVRTPSPRRRRDDLVDEYTTSDREAGRRASTTSPIPGRFNSAGSRYSRRSAGRGAFQSPLRTRTRERSLEGERGVRQERFSLPPRRYLSGHRQGRPSTQQVQGEISEALRALSHFAAGGLRRLRANQPGQSIWPTTESDLGRGAF